MVLVCLLVVVADQVLKFWVKTNFYLGESVRILPFFELKFIENNGMAFGMELWNKYLLTFGRIGAVILFSRDPRTKMGDTEQKLALSAAGFLGRQMEQ